MCVSTLSKQCSREELVVTVSVWLYNGTCLHELRLCASLSV